MRLAARSRTTNRGSKRCASAGRRILEGSARRAAAVPEVFRDDLAISRRRAIAIDESQRAGVLADAEDLRQHMNRVAKLIVSMVRRRSEPEHVATSVGVQSACGQPAR